jgi:general stress protein 26
MTKPQPRPLDPAEVVGRALAVLQAARCCFLATTDGDQPRLRPMSPVRTDGFTVYLANFHGYNKTREIAANPHVELCFLDGQHDQVRITGIAEVVTDGPVLQEVRGPATLLRGYLETVDSSQFILYCIRPTRVRYMQEWALEYMNVPLAPPDNVGGSPTTG